MGRYAAPPEQIERQRNFGLHLTEAMRIAGYRQRDVADALNFSQSAVTYWCRGGSVPSPPTIVFDLERLLHLPPGHLSKHLGFVPTSTSTEDADPVARAAISAASGLTVTQKRVLLAQLDEWQSAENTDATVAPTTKKRAPSKKAGKKG